MNEFPDWTANVVGDESREKISIEHPRINKMGFQTHKNVLDLFKKTSISVVCSRWNEPFGRTSLESSSRGCAVIISNRGGLPETTSDALILKDLTKESLYESIKKLIIDKKFRLNLQRNSLKNFYLTNKFISKKIDTLRENLFTDHIVKKKKNIKILHITNFNERHNGRLFYNTGRRINNGFIRLNHSVLTISDRDIISYHRSFKDMDGSQKLNLKLLETISNYVPDLIVFGHADSIHADTLSFIKNYYPKTRLAQWFLDKMDSAWIKNKKRFIDKINLMDCSFCTTSPDKLRLKSSDKAYYIPNPADISFETLECYKNENQINDLFFAMSHGVHRGILKKGKVDKRSIFIENLKNKNPHIKFDLYGLENKQPIWSDDYKLALNKCKMALNLSQGEPSKYYSSDRIAQLVANGILTFIDERTQLNKLFKNNEVVFYKSLDDLTKKINFYLNNKTLRNKIAKKGKEKYLKHLNSTKVASYIVNRSMNFQNKEKFIWE